MEIIGRQPELAAIREVLDGARHGQGAALVLRGKLGVGLSALVAQAVAAAPDMAVASVPGIESERHLPFAGLHRLCVPMLEGLEELPVPQGEALASALGLQEKGVPDQFLVGLALLRLLTRRAAERPLLCAVDDSQWLDDESVDALAFAARRLGGKRIAFIFSVHEPTHVARALAGISSLDVAPLADDAARELLGQVVAGPLELSVRERLVEEASGMPLALTDLPAQLTGEQLAGYTALPAMLPVGERMKERLLGGLAELPTETRTLLLLAAVEPDAPVDVVWSAAFRLRISALSAAPAESAGVLHLGERFHFTHPLLRLALYQDAPVADRCEAHKAIATVANPGVTRERRAWHRAAAALTPDEDVADELEALSRQARSHGGPAAAASLLERAAALTAEPSQRYKRTLAAVQAAVAAGSLARATSLLDRALPESLDELQMAQAETLRGSIALALGQGVDRATTLLRAAKALEPLDAHLARDTLLESMEAAVYGGRFSRGTTMATVADVARARATTVTRPLDAGALLLNSLGGFVTLGRRAAMALVHEALDDVRVSVELRWFGLASLLALEVWDDETLHDLAERQAELVGSHASPRLGPGIGPLLDLDNVVAGRFGSPRLAASQHPGPGPTGSTAWPAAGPSQLLAAAWRGLPTEARELAEAYMRQAFVYEQGFHVALANHALAVLENSLGRYDAALLAARRACDEPTLFVPTATLPELVEAAVRAGENELALSALAQLAERAEVSGTPWALGMLERSQALVYEGACRRRSFT